MSIDIEKELVDKHTDQEIIAYLYKVMNGVLKNYVNGLNNDNSKFLWGTYGDIVFVTSLLKQIKQRNDAIEAQKQSMV